MAQVARVILKKTKEKSLLRFHPWVFSGAILSVRGNPQRGETVKVYSEEGKYLATGAFSPDSQIRVRVWSFQESQLIDRDFFFKKIQLAQLNRQVDQLTKVTDSYRLIHGENDGLPGLVCDRYGDVLVVQCLTVGVELHKSLIVECLQAVTGCQQVYERSDADSRKLEGLPSTQGWLAGDLARPTQVNIHEHGLEYTINLETGHKTGFYLDQRDNRLLVAQHAKGAMLNCFCYTGGFSIAALKHGQIDHVLSIDSSALALTQAKKMYEANFSDVDLAAPSNATWLEADVFAQLRHLFAEGKRFDTIVLDPPKLAPTSSNIEQASRAYKDLNLWALKLLKPNGLLFTYSCSSGISVELFQKIVAGAAVDVRVDVQIIKRLGAGQDHPVGLHFPEGEYLKGLFLRKL